MWPVEPWFLLRITYHPKKIKKKIIREIWHPHPDLVGLAPWSSKQFDGCSVVVQETILITGGPSTQTLCAVRRTILEVVCQPLVDPVHCTESKVLTLLQGLLNDGKFLSTVNVYVAAISGYHDTLDGTSLGAHKLLFFF